jgi:type 1 glutamine amidotransferase
MTISNSTVPGMILLLFASLAAADEGFKPIFNGQSLDGWSAPDMSYWSVEEGAITARSTAEHPCKANQFLVWRQGELDDFELKLKFRIAGDASANSGIQFRGSVNPDGHVVGYQADMDRAGQWIGALYDEHTPRRLLAARGQKTEIDRDGKRRQSTLGDPAKLLKNVDINGWNEYHITARGGKITLKINGKATAKVVDDESAQRDLSGVLALQLHSGPPMTVQFKDIRLKRLPLSDGRKKVVFSAGNKSHQYGAHDHKAGCTLLAHRLNASGLPLYATVYYPGYPADPTAFDNADSIVFYCDGGAGHPANAHLAELDAKVSQGVGMACIHYGVETTPGANGQAFLRWIGGYFEPHWSVNPFWEIKEMTLAKDHPITRGVKPFQIVDEFYYHMRFREGMSGVTPIITAMPPASTLVKPNGELARPEGPHSNNPHVRASVLERKEPQHIAWASENEGGGRGFGFTGGHVHWNWAHDDFRKLVLNAIAWTARVEIPADGVRSNTPTLEEMMAHHDEEPSISVEQIRSILGKINPESVK